MTKSARQAIAVLTVMLLSVATTAAVRAAPPAGAPARPADSYLATSLPTVTSGERPGPSVLYAPPPPVPQLENAQPWFAAPFDRVSGTDRYVDGEYFYTDHLYDDRGADSEVVYPTDRERYGDNAADLVEFRISTRNPARVAFRFTLNTLLAPDTTIAVAAFDTDNDEGTGSSTLAYDPGAPFPGTDAVLTVWGTGAAWSTWDGSAWQQRPVDASADLARNQLVAVAPPGVIDPAGTWRTTVGVGLRDPETGGFLMPQPDASDTRPGGPEGASGIFNLGFRFDEPVVTEGDDPDAAQAEALGANEPAQFAHEIDMTALAAGEARTTVPVIGPMVRFFPSRLPLGEGKNLDEFPAFLGQLQSYALYVPTSYSPGTPTPLTLNLHSLGQRYWQYTGSDGIQQLGEDRGNLVATADARGENGWYQNEAEYDVFEMWNDIASHYSLDPYRTYITGYSMGGYATYRLGTLYPDLFARAGSVVGPPGDGIWLGIGAPTGGAATLSNLWLENARNLPYMNIVGVLDELVPISGTTQQNIGPAYSGRTSFDALGYRVAFDVYETADHLILAILGYDLPQLRDWMGDHTVDRDPFHVTFAYTPAADDPALGLVHDKAYWVSGVRVRDPAVGTQVSVREPIVGKGVIDVESHAFGIDDPDSMRGVRPGTDSPLPYTEYSRSWAEPPAREPANVLAVTLTNIASATVDLLRARIDPALPVELRITSDGPAAVTLTGADGRRATIVVEPGTRTYTVAPGDLR